MVDVGVVKGHEKDKEISVVRPYANPMKDKDESSFVNVDTTTSEGLSRARKMKMAESGLVECMVIPLLYEAKNLFTSHIFGRILTIFRHPLEKSVVGLWISLREIKLMTWLKLNQVDCLNTSIVYCLIMTAGTAPKYLGVFTA